MKYVIEIDDQSYTVELERERHRGVARIDGRSVEFEVSEPEPGVYTILTEAQVQEVRLVNHKPDSPLEALFRNQRIFLRVFDPKRLRRRGALSVTGRIELKATMPGRIVAWLRQPGDVVGEGEGVIVVEAMKMQNEVRSPKAGTVSELRAQPGRTVNAGEILAIIE